MLWLNPRPKEEPLLWPGIICIVLIFNVGFFNRSNLFADQAVCNSTMVFPSRPLEDANYTKQDFYCEHGNIFHDTGKSFSRIATNEFRDQTCLSCGYMKPTSLSKYINMYDVSECELVISTVLFKGYDKFVPLGDGYDEVPDYCYFVFTDSTSKYQVSRGYTHVYVNISSDDMPYDDTARLSKIFKVIPQRVFNNLRWHVHLAGKSSLKLNYRQLLCEFRSSRTNIMVERNPVRVDVYEEGKDVKSNGKAIPEIVDKQLQDYKHQGYPRKSGLLDGHFLFRDFGSSSIHMMSCMWFDEINRGSRRDQLSFNYVAWKLGVEITYYPNHHFVKDHKHIFKDVVN